MGARQARPRVGEPSGPACQGRPHATTSYQCQRVHSTPCGDNAGRWRGSLSPQEPTWYHACQTLKPVCPSEFWVWDLGAQTPARCRGEVEGGHGVPGRTQEDQDLLWAAALGARDPLLPTQHCWESAQGLRALPGAECLLIFLPGAPAQLPSGHHARSQLASQSQ